MNVVAVCETIPHDRHSACSIGLAWVLGPILSLDATAVGQRASSEIEQLVNETWQLLISNADTRDLELRVRDRDEVDAQELEAPASYRSDLLNVLQFGLRSARTQDPRWLASALAMGQDSLYFLQQEAGQTQDDHGAAIIDGVAKWARSAHSLDAFSADLAPLRSQVGNLVSAALARRS